MRGNLIRELKYYSALQICRAFIDVGSNSEGRNSEVLLSLHCQDVDGGSHGQRNQVCLSGEFRVSKIGLVGIKKREVKTGKGGVKIEKGRSEIKKGGVKKGRG